MGFYDWVVMGDFHSPVESSISLLCHDLFVVVLIVFVIQFFKFLYVRDQIFNLMMMLDVKVFGSQKCLVYGSLVCEYKMFMVGDDKWWFDDDGGMSSVSKSVVGNIKKPSKVLVMVEGIYAWNIPILAIKADAVGVNMIDSWVDNDGLYHGGCVEMCGVHPSHMPSVVESVSPEDFYDWVESMREMDQDPAMRPKGMYFSETFEKGIPIAAREPSGGVFIDADARYEFVNKVFYVSMGIFKKMEKLEGGLDAKVVCEINGAMKRCQKFYYLTASYLGNYLYLSRGGHMKCDDKDEGVVMVWKSLDTCYKSGLKFLSDVLNSGKISDEQKKKIGWLVEEWEKEYKELFMEKGLLVKKVNKQRKRWWKF
nr:cytochrome c oxidase subunit II [Anadara sp. SS-2018]